VRASRATLYFTLTTDDHQADAECERCAMLVAVGGQ